MEKLLFLATHRRRSFDSEESSRDSPDNNRRVEKGVEYHPPIDCEEEEEESDDTEDLITTGYYLEFWRIFPWSIIKYLM